MGNPYNDLVAVAVLYLNPGITKEVFVELLDQTHSSFYRNYGAKDGLCDYNPTADDERFHNGLVGLARLLKIELTSEYTSFITPKTDEYGLALRPPSLEDVHDEGNTRFKVIVQEGHELSKPETVFDASHERPTIGKIWDDDALYETGFIDEIVEVKEIPPNPELLDYGDPEVLFESVLMVRKITGKYKIHRYQTKEKALVEWPLFDPKNQYQWNQRAGIFHLGDRHGSDDFTWCQEGDRYYFDLNTYDQIPISLADSGKYGFTDLLMTVEAIKLGAWKVLSNKGFKFLGEFMERYPDVLEIWKRGVYDWGISMYAKSVGMSTRDMLRFRLGLHKLDDRLLLESSDYLDKLFGSHAPFV